MKYVGFILVLLCMPALLVAKWVAFPLSNELEGLRFSILGYSGAHPGPAWLSFGILACVLLAVAAAACLWRRRGVACCAGAALLLLALAAYLQVAVGDAALLRRLAAEADWSEWANKFAHHFLAFNSSLERSATWPLLSFDTVADRLVSGWYFMGLGWYVAAVAGLSLFAGGLRGLDRRPRKLAMATTCVCAVVIGAAWLANPLLAQHAFVEAARAQAQGRFDEAVKGYRAAIALDSWQATGTSLYERIGAIDSISGRTSTPEYHLYHAEYLAREQRMPEAIAEYDVLAASKGRLEEAARSRAIELATDYGLRLYADGAFGAAVAAWQGVLVREPTMWLAAFYLSQGYFAVERYREAAELIERDIHYLNDPVFLGNLYSNTGDSETRLGRYGDAHLKYSSAYKMDFIKNPRAISSLIGP